MLPHVLFARPRRTAAAIALSIGALVSVTAGAGAVVQRTSSHDVASTISRVQVIARAASWVTQGVPYSQTRWWSDGNGSYRQDCSGFVAMAWALDQSTNYWTGNLATVAYRISSSDLRPGDILLRAGDHTVIFAGWADATRTSFNLYEQFRPGYSARYVSDASLSSYLGRGFGPYRYRGIVD
jgi:cell wall-associated NlpC family hydrolase